MFGTLRFASKNRHLISIGPPKCFFFWLSTRSDHDPTHNSKALSVITHVNVTVTRAALRYLMRFLTHMHTYTWAEWIHQQFSFPSTHQTNFVAEEWEAEKWIAPPRNGEIARRWNFWWSFFRYNEEEEALAECTETELIFFHHNFLCLSRTLRILL